MGYSTVWYSYASVLSCGLTPVCGSIHALPLVQQLSLRSKAQASVHPVVSCARKRAAREGVTHMKGGAVPLQFIPLRCLGSFSSCASYGTYHIPHTITLPYYCTGWAMPYLTDHYPDLSHVHPVTCDVGAPRAQSVRRRRRRRRTPGPEQWKAAGRGLPQTAPRPGIIFFSPPPLPGCSSERVLTPVAVCLNSP